MTDEMPPRPSSRSSSCGSGRNSGAVGGQLDHLLAGALDEPVVLPARARHDHARSVGAEHLEHDRESGARARREQHLVRLEADLGVGVVEQPVAVEELGDLAAHVHPSDRGPVAVHGVAGDALRGPHHFRVRREVGVLVVALRQVERAFLLDAAREQADERLGRGQRAGGEAPGLRCTGRLGHRHLAGRLVASQGDTAVRQLPQCAQAARTAAACPQLPRLRMAAPRDKRVPHQDTPMTTDTQANGYEIVARQDFSDVTFLLEVRHPMLAKAARAGPVRHRDVARERRAHPAHHRRLRPRQGHDHAGHPGRRQDHPRDAARLQGRQPPGRAGGARWVFRATSATRRRCCASAAASASRPSSRRRAAYKEAAPTSSASSASATAT